MRLRINGCEGGLLQASDRALAYGDGVFRTLEWVGGQPRLWPYHYARLTADCAALSLPLPDEGWLLHELALAAGTLARAVVKVTVSRGVGGRGYAIPAAATPTVMVAAAAWDGYPPDCARDGVVVRWCDMRLAIQPRLAGIKHLNRLENVLARSEWQDAAIREGLLLDMDGWLVEGTMSNVLLVQGGEVLTPRLDRCGVSGAMRARLLDALRALAVPVHETRLAPEALLAADEVWLCNSLLGLWPVAALGERCWQDFALARRLQAVLASA